MDETKSKFLKEFLEFCKKHKAEFYYTTDDDGIHIAVDGVEVYVGLLEDDLKSLESAVNPQPPTVDR